MISETTSPMTSAVCEARLDRLVLNATPRNCGQRCDFLGFRRMNDHLVRRQGKIRTYARVRVFRSLTGDARIVLQYDPVATWLQSWRITMTGDDRTGITPDQIQSVLTPCRNHKLSLVEIAFDFIPESGVDRTFVLQHGKFGKSRRRLDRGGEGQIRYGGRGCPKLVRCYWKKELDRYRVELEVHPALLRKCSVSKVTDFGTLCSNLLRSHIRFVGIRRRKLDACLANKFGSNGRALLDGARERAAVSLRRALRFLSRNGVANPHRFLYGLRINDEIKLALRAWHAHFLP